MIDDITAKLLDPRFLAMALTGVAAAATAFALLQPILEPDNLGKRMKLVSDEREVIRKRERDRLANKVTLRTEPKAYMRRIVEQFDLNRWLGTDTAKLKLQMAGYRGVGAETSFPVSSAWSCPSWRCSARPSTCSSSRCSTSPSWCASAS